MVGAASLVQIPLKKLQRKFTHVLIPLLTKTLNNGPHDVVTNICMYN